MTDGICLPHPHQVAFSVDQVVRWVSNRRKINGGGRENVRHVEQLAFIHIFAFSNGVDLLVEKSRISR